MDLFKEAEHYDSIVRPHTPEVTKSSAKPAPATVASTETMKKIQTDILERHFMPDAATREDLLRRSRLPKGSTGWLRSRVALGTWPTQDIFAGKLPYGHFAGMCAARMDKNNTGSHASPLYHAEPYGDWVPVAIQFKDDVEIMLDGLVEVTDTREITRATGALVTKWDPDGTEAAHWFRPAATQRDVLGYAILFVDAKGMPDVKRDEKGAEVRIAEVTIQQQTDPALVSVLERLADRVNTPATPAQGSLRPVDPGQRK